MKSNWKDRQAQRIRGAAVVMADLGITAPPAEVREAVSAWAFQILKRALECPDPLRAQILMIWGQIISDMARLWVALDECWDRAIGALADEA